MHLRLITLALLSVAACSDPAANSGPAQLMIDGGAERTIRIGAQEQLRARVVGGEPAGSIRWTTSDSSIARVDANGLLRLATTYTACNWVTPGECQVRITATTNDLRADLTLTVMPFEPTLELNVAHLDLEMGDSVRITARVLLENNTVPWCAVSYATRDSAIAQIGMSSGIVRVGDEGSTVVDVVASGPLCPRDAAHVTITTRPARHVLTILPGDATNMAAHSVLQLFAEVTNWKGIVYQAAFVEWSTSNAALATVQNGLVRAGSCSGTELCRVTITARSGRLVATRNILIL